MQSTTLSIVRCSMHSSNKICKEGGRLSVRFHRYMCRRKAVEGLINMQIKEIRTQINPLDVICILKKRFAFTKQKENLLLIYMQVSSMAHNRLLVPVIIEVSVMQDGTHGSLITYHTHHSSFSYISLFIAIALLTYTGILTVLGKIPWLYFLPIFIILALICAMILWQKVSCLSRFERIINDLL